ncbi:hypothetical protein NE237_002556 [Protea cynaroides]|uniref:Retroviral aspartyl protease n=1 Tax=Protea cynaroides TaxID=273540 RepID=A0A9Q0KVE8_9MAGN|nr:hypothetical protein NE237_002556 [Protea cynaroides]
MARPQLCYQTPHHFGITSTPTGTPYPYQTPTPRRCKLAGQGIMLQRDEKFSPNHRCKNRQIFLLESISDDIEFPPNESVEDSAAVLEESEPITTLPTESEISYHALAGQSSATTLRFTATVCGSPLQVLVDSGSTHNFLQSRVAEHLHLPVEPITNMKVLVGNGTTLQSEGIVRQLPVQFHSYNTVVDALVLPIVGADLVLGVQWLSTLGPVTFDYQKLSMQFKEGTNRISLIGNPRNTPTQLGYRGIRGLVQMESVAAYYHLEVSVPTKQPQLTLPQIYKEY